MFCKTGCSRALIGCGVAREVGCGVVKWLAGVAVAGSPVQFLVMHLSGWGVVNRCNGALSLRSHTNMPAQKLLKKCNFNYKITATLYL